MESFGWELELRIQTAESRIRWVHVTGEALEADGDCVGLHGAIVDVTMMKEREQRLQVLNRILRHNLRNDLNVILGRAEMLSEELGSLAIPAAFYEMNEMGPFLQELDRLRQDADSLQEQIDIVQQGMTFLASFAIDDAKTSADVILKKYHDLNQLGEKARGLDRVITELSGSNRTPVALRPLFAAVQERFEDRFPEATIDIDCEDEVLVLGIDTALERALNELVENALVHSEPADCRVILAASECAAGHVEIRVVDDGPGIPAMERETLRRGTETPVFHGQEIGLWLVAWIIRRLNGKIAIHDRDPQGSTVVLELPRPPAEE